MSVEIAEEIRTVRVSDIAEYPTALGSRCLLLRKLGFDAYLNTEEELMDALTISADNPENLNICLQQSRCRAFWDKYELGVTPYIEKDPIRLIEYNGKYWVTEGKHRVCLAKRAGVKSIEAHVWQHAEDMYSLLTGEGTPGRFHYLCEYSPVKKHKTKGQMAVMWVQSPRGTRPSRFDFGPCLLDVKLDTHGELVTVLPGLSYMVSVSIQKSRILGIPQYYRVESEVIIEPGHAKTRIWLLNADARDIYRPYPVCMSQYHTDYRRGCWRNSHNRRLKSCAPGLWSLR